MKFDFDLFLGALLSARYLRGAVLAVILAIFVQASAIVIGFFIAQGRRSHSVVWRSVTAAYVWLFRAIPALLVLIIIWNALPQLIPVMKESWFKPSMAAYLGLTLLESALMAEILRSAIDAIQPGQTLAGRALGLGPVSVTVRIIIPQMIRTAIPPTGNQFINMIKMTSLASVISLQELLYTASQDVSRTFRYAEYYSAATIYYFVIVSAFMYGQSLLEKRYSWNSSTRK